MDNLKNGGSTPYLPETMLYSQGETVYNKIAAEEDDLTLEWEGTMFLDSTKNGMKIVDQSTKAAAVAYLFIYQPHADNVGVSNIAVKVTETSAPVITGGIMQTAYFVSIDGVNFTELSSGIAVCPASDDENVFVVAICQYHNPSQTSVTTIQSNWDFDVTFTAGNAEKTQLAGTMQFPNRIKNGVILPLDFESSSISNTTMDIAGQTLSENQTIMLSPDPSTGYVVEHLEFKNVDMRESVISLETAFDGGEGMVVLLIDKTISEEDAIMSSYGAKNLYQAFNNADAEQRLALLQDDNITFVLLFGGVDSTGSVFMPITDGVCSISMNTASFDNAGSVSCWIIAVSDTGSEMSLSFNYTTDPLQYELSDDGRSYAVSGFNAKEWETVEIPSTYKGLPVTEIKDGAFMGVNLGTLIIPESITTCGYLFGERNDLDYIGHLIINCDPSIVKLESNRETASYEWAPNITSVTMTKFNGELPEFLFSYDGFGSYKVQNIYVPENMVTTAQQIYNARYNQLSANDAMLSHWLPRATISAIQ